MAGWTESERFWFAPSHRRTAPAPGGETGLQRTQDALPGAPGVRLGVAGEFSTERDVFFAGDRNTRLAGTLGASWGPAGADWLEIFAAYRNASNRNASGQPSIILAQGDLRFGAKAGRALPLPVLAGSLALGGGLALDPRVGVDDLAFEAGATSVEARLLASFDARRIWRRLPLVAHLNLGWVTPSPVSAAGGVKTNCLEEYAVGASRYHRGILALAAEVPLPKVTPWIESRVDLPVNPSLVDDERCNVVPTAAEPKKLSFGNIIPATLGLGVRLTMVSDVVLSLGGEFGLTSAKEWGVPATPAFNLFGSLSYSFDPWRAPETHEVVREKVVEKVVETVRESIVEKRVEAPPPPPPPPPTTGRVTGRVFGVNSAPLAGAFIRGPGGGPPTASDKGTGAYLTFDLPAGPTRLTVEAPGHETAEADVEVKAGGTVERDVEMKPLPAKAGTPGRVSGRVVEADGGGIIPGAIVRVSVPDVLPTASESGSGKYLTHELPAGAVRLVAEADGHDPGEVEVIVKAGQLVTRDIPLLRRGLPGTLSGVVRLPSGKPLAGAQVTLSGPDPLQATTDSNGRYSLPVPPGTWTVRVQSRDRLSRTGSVLVAEKTPATLDAVMPPGPEQMAVSLEMGGEYGLSRDAARTPAGLHIFGGFAYTADPTRDAIPRDAGDGRVVEAGVTEKTIEKRTEVVPLASPSTGRISGRVMEAAGGAPIGDAILRAPGSVPPTASDRESGRFLTHSIPAGKVRLTVEAAGHDPALVEVDVKGGTTVVKDIALRRAGEAGTLSGLVRGTGGRPAKGATVTVECQPPAQTVTGPAGTYTLKVSPGRWPVRVEAPGRLARGGIVEIASKKTAKLNATLPPQPERSSVSIVSDTVELGTPITFGGSGAKLAASDKAVLDEVIDALVREAPLRKVRVVARVGSQRTEAESTKTAKARAAAVRDYLVAQGLAGSRVEVEGRGAAAKDRKESTDKLEIELGGR